MGGKDVDARVVALRIVLQISAGGRGLQVLCATMAAAQKALRYKSHAPPVLASALTEVFETCRSIVC